MEFHLSIGSIVPLLYTCMSTNTYLCPMSMARVLHIHVRCSGRANDLFPLCFHLCCSSCSQSLLSVNACMTSLKITLPQVCLPTSLDVICSTSKKEKGYLDNSVENACLDRKCSNILSWSGPVFTPLSPGNAE